MTESRKIHLAMINSFNIITRKTSYNRVVNSDIPLFAHDIYDGPTKIDIEYMIKHFESVEMFEKCMELKNVIDLIETGSNKNGELICECDFPDPKKYTIKTKCETCKRQILA